MNVLDLNERLLTLIAQGHGELELLVEGAFGILYIFNSARVEERDFYDGEGFVPYCILSNRIIREEE